MFVLSNSNSIGNQFLAELRDVNIQKDSMRFRRNLERIGELLAYEISKTLTYQKQNISTSLGSKETNILVEKPVLVTIMRAGLPLHQGFLNYFDQSESAFIGAYRGVHNTNESFEIEMDYLSSPSIEGKTLILCDPMLATGKSLEKAYNAILKFGQPAKTHVVSVVASVHGVKYIKEQMPNCQLWLGDIDEELNLKSYIIPGLGDAGDLAYGTKI
jgi:uracil phosphoribosyltransferase